ncbi:hypothetical protein TSAR_000935 [Trichomalopsis sarcophagae]|uniref:Uncharacterized protein n=1 Tax=Trichomalopsis sarcophagae TaxID=543379 RepID=A0A232EF47_9HYME|nr:hypothetical protein TSAR_000935 [Trichomalopsis sarcophagae]
MSKIKNQITIKSQKHKTLQIQSHRSTDNPTSVCRHRKGYVNNPPECRIQETDASQHNVNFFRTQYRR